jgi:hypothetical protein
VDFTFEHDVTYQSLNVA